ncbi:hypothetical protein M422DRAFT_245298 [Sphaerobolus stellatus SS14]|nr:hypothetical protein M422DRAFT_245298 [Sphaerobolus stellatus SS14]
MPPDDDFRYAGPLSARRKHPPGHGALFCTRGFYDLLSVIPILSTSCMLRMPTRLRSSSVVGVLTGWATRRAPSSPTLPDPRWADPIKKIFRQKATQARAVAQIVTAMRDDPASRFRDPPLRVINATLSSTGATMNRSTDEDVEGLPGTRPSALRWGGLSTHAEEAQDGEVAQEQILQGLPQVQVPQAQLNATTPRPTTIPTRPFPSPPKKPITPPPLTTLEKAVTTRLYFENIYFPLHLRHPPSLDQRLQALERDLTSLSVPESHKADIRERWRRNETEYLRGGRRDAEWMLGVSSS